MVKRLLFFLCLLPSLIAADSANDVLLSQRNAGNTGNVQRNISGTALGAFGFDGSSHPITYAASAFGWTWHNLADATAGRTALGLGSLAVLNAAPAGTLTGSSLASGVTASSLLSAAGGSFGTNAFNSTAFGTGTVTAVTVTPANGVSATVANQGTTPAFTFTLGAITPATVNGLTLTTGTGTLTLGSVTLNAGAGGTLGSAAFTSASAYEVPLTFSTGLTRSTNTVTVNTTQNITKLSGLTSNGLVTTSGGDGTLGVTVPGTGVLTALGVNVGSAGAVVVNGGALGTPSGGNVTAALPAFTGDITTSAGAAATTLATVNSNVGSFTATNLTVDAKGRITAASSGTGVSFANPSASVGLTAVNGSASTAMRSDAAPALSVAIVPTWTGLHTFSPTQTANTSTDGLVLDSVGPATSGNQFYSGRLRMRGYGWKTNSTAGSQPVDAIFELQPEQGTANPGRKLVGAWSVNSGSYSNFFVIDESVGGVGIGSNLTFGGAGASAVNVVIGASASDGSQGLVVVIGQGASATGGAAVVVGRNAIGWANSVMIGSGASQGGGFHSSIGIGSGVTTTASNQAVFGASGTPMDNVFFGKGVVNTTATDYTINGTGGSGSNNAAGSLILAAGKSTGTATPAAVKIQTTVAGSTGSTAQTLATTAQFDNNGATFSSATVAGTAIKNIRHGISGAMTAGTVTVTDAGCTANTRYFFTTHTIGTITLPSNYFASTRTASTSFVITSSQITDTSTVDWMAIEP